MLIAGALNRGLTLKDFNELTIGQIVEYCITYNEVNNTDDEEKEETTIKKATQEDWDSF